jgi:cellulose synthase/poly-beta-1,6-N-acetylglucosamine synthase-like glycosyltransferase
MWLLILIFLIVTAILGWTMFGYFIFVWFLGLLRPKRELTFPATWPMVTIIIPCFNEEGQILSKIENTQILDYPKDRMEVIFVDGGSEDDTVRLLTDAVRDDEHIRIIECSQPGKTHQLNEALSLASWLLAKSLLTPMQTPSCQLTPCSGLQLSLLGPMMFGL